MFYNSFAEIWTETLNNVEFQKLCELYNLGKKLASTEMKGVRISFQVFGNMILMSIFRFRSR